MWQLHSPLRGQGCPTWMRYWDPPWCQSERRGWRLPERLPESTPVFLHSKNALFINELRFRQLLNDVYHEKKYLMRAYVDSTGAVEPVQLKCRITECNQLATGQAFYIIERVACGAARGLSMDGDGQYLMDEVNELPGEAGPSGNAETERLCQDVFSHLKAYLRLARKVPPIESNEDPDSLRYLCLSPAIMESMHEKDAATFSTPWQTSCPRCRK